MSEVAVLFKVYPKDDMFDTALKGIKEMTPKPAGMQVEDIAFGIKVIKVAFRFNDSETSSSKLEDNLRNIEGVGELDVEEEGLV